MTTSLLGVSVPRSEDRRLITGAARYVDNLPVDGALRAAFLRSALAHARIDRIDTAAAVALPGVVAVLTAADLGLAGGDDPTARPALAGEVVRYAGEPIVLVVAVSAAVAADAVEAVVVDYDPLPVVVDPEAARTPDSPVLFPGVGSNVVDQDQRHWDDDVLAGADVVVRGRFVNQRLAPVPLETAAIVAIPDGDGGLTVWASSQAPFGLRRRLARALRLEQDDVVVRVPDVGGGFGAKIAAAPEFLAIAAAARRLGRPVRWHDERSGSMTSLQHGRAQIHDVELGADRDGRIVGLRASILADLGAYPQSDWLPSSTASMLSGAYLIPRIATRTALVVTNTTPIGPYRGAGRPEAAALVERAMDLLAAELGVDPVELRRRNFVASGDFPYRTATGRTYDSGDYAGALDRALGIAGYNQLRRDQAARREHGERRLLGIGVACYVEFTAAGLTSEIGAVEVAEDGTVTVRTGISPHGQGHETSLAQVTAHRLGVAVDEVRVVHSDTAAVPSGVGTFGSRSLQLGGTAAWRACDEVVALGRRLAAHLLEAAVDDVVHADGRIGVAGAPERSLSWAQLASAAADAERRPDGFPARLAATAEFDQGHPTYPFGSHVSVVEVDLDTGLVTPLRHVAVDDAGRILNPMLAEGQVHGGIAQGIGQALFEAVVYDPDGNPLTANLTTYQVPGAPDLPRFETVRTETPAPSNPLGAKGIGEAPTIGATPAVHNAVIDAVSHLGIRHIDMPLTPERVRRAITAAGEGAVSG